jgi:hypothetical protein
VEKKNLGKEKQVLGNANQLSGNVGRLSGKANLVTELGSGKAKPGPSYGYRCYELNCEVVAV